MKDNNKNILKQGLFLILLVLCLGITIFSAVAEQLDSKPELKDNKTIETLLVKVEFHEDYKLKDYDLTKITTNSYHAVSIDTGEFPEAKGVSATIQYKSICLSNPIALHNGEWDKGVQVEQVGLCKFNITVYGWSSWQLVDSNFGNGTFVNTTQYSGGLGLARDQRMTLHF